ncbi:MULTISPECIES: hypothetical protein [unclassified Streptomyces]|uniref:hypothetical protein n=1 Tax=unclassified Streptomyces TaxID=2593676 RepID=UPI003446C9AF
MIAENYDIEEAAKLLRCFPRYLEDNLRHLPHQKIGAAVAFDERDIEAIRDMHRVRPVPRDKGGTTPSAASTLTLASIQPSLRRRKNG